MIINHPCGLYSPPQFTSNEFVEAARILGLAPRQSAYEIEPNSFEVADVNDELQIETQSVLSALAYLSNAVSVPEAHIKKRLAQVSKRDEMLSDLIKIHVVCTRFEDAYLSVPSLGLLLHAVECVTEEIELLIGEALWQRGRCTPQHKQPEIVLPGLQLDVCDQLA